MTVFLTWPVRCIAGENDEVISASFLLFRLLSALMANDGLVPLAPRVGHAS